MKMFKLTDNDRHIDQADQATASKSKRVMRAERGQKPEFIGDRKVERARSRSLKAKNRYGNNLHGK